MVYKILYKKQVKLRDDTWLKKKKKNWGESEKRFAGVKGYKKDKCQELEREQNFKSRKKNMTCQKRKDFNY